MAKSSHHFLLYFSHYLIGAGCVCLLRWLRERVRTFQRHYLYDIHLSLAFLPFCSVSFYPSLISITIQMVTFKAASHADWLAGKWGRRKGGTRSGAKETFFLSFFWEHWEIFTSPLPPSLPMPPRCKWLQPGALNRVEFPPHSQESWTDPSFYSVIVHPFTSPHTHCSVYRLFVSAVQHRV